MAMIFATLAKTQASGAPWTEEAETEIAGQYTALLQSGGLKVSVYRIDPRRLLVTMQTGWYGEDVIEFLTAQPAVMKATWDSIDYENPDVEQEPDEALPPSEKTAASTTAKRKKQQRASSSSSSSSSTKKKKKKAVEKDDL